MDDENIKEEYRQRLYELLKNIKRTDILEYLCAFTENVVKKWS